MASHTPSVNPTASFGTPPFSHDVIDSATGRLSMPWAAWLNLLYARVGHGANNNIQNAQAAAELAAIGADQSGDIAATADELRDELAGIVDTSEGRIAALAGEVRSEIASVVEGVSNQAFQDFVNSQFMYETDWSQQIKDGLATVTYALSGPISPSFTYTLGLLTQVDYPDGSMKVLTYSAGQLSTLVFSRPALPTVTKTFNYTGGVLTSIVQT